ncbi:zinc finger CCHC domain-containing protein 12-like [Tachysurus ichikawai]
MDIVKRENVNVNNAVLVGGITLSERDDDLEQWLMRYGSIQRTLLIDCPTSEFYRHAIIEFQYSSAMDELRPLLPL